MVLNYYVTTEPTGFSLSPYDSDALGNLTVMEHVVGTLVKYGGGARYEPFLAERWSVSSDAREWDFFLRNSIADDKGTPITAPNYVRGLATVLFRLSKSDPALPVFEHLVNWSKFLKTGAVEDLGVRATSDGQVRFAFSKKPDGFLEYLAMPYYGFYDLADFAADGSWKNPQTITASGAFRVMAISQNEVTLEKRKGWFSLVEGGPDRVLIRNTDFETAKKDSGHSIIFRKLSDEEGYPKRFRLVSATPTILNGLVLSPYIQRLFHDPENRKLFYVRLRETQKSFAFHSPNASFSEYFYPLSKSDLAQVKPSYTNFKVYDSQPLKVSISSTLTPGEQEYSRELIRRVFAGSDIKIDFVIEDRKKPGWLDEMRTNRAFDIRMARVDIGGNIENWGIKMMFCSKLGIGFPDVNGKVCSLVGRYEDILAIDEQYVREFNAAVHDDMTVIPLWHSSLTWLFSEDLGLEHFSPTMTFPRFDLLTLN